jgi:U32 family peptidase
MPMFHMEHCVFAAFLSNGKDWRDCGRPCDRHKVDLRDRVGAAFPVIADVGCRNTVFNSVPQSAAD